MGSPSLPLLLLLIIIPAISLCFILPPYEYQQPFPTDESFQNFIQSYKKSHANISNPSTLSPIVVVPPCTGSTIQATLKNVSSYLWCSSNLDTPYTMWLDQANFQYLAISCWSNNFRLQSSPSGLQINQTGVFASTPEWGMWGNYGEFMRVISQFGWHRGFNVYGVAYDWRASQSNYYPVAPDGKTVNHDAYYPILQAAIERAYNEHNQTQVTVTSLSMGSIVLARFLDRYVTQEWKDKYIRTHIAFCPAIGGSIKAVESLVSDKSWLVHVAGSESNGETMKKVAQTLGGIVTLMPDPLVYGADEKIMGNPVAEYTTGDFEKMMSDVNAPVAVDVLRVMREQNLWGYKEPGTSVHIIHGVGVPTPKYIYYRESSMKNWPEEHHGDGDGWVLNEGMAYLKKFDCEKYPVRTYTVPGLVHGGSVWNHQALQYALDILLSP